MSFSLRERSLLRRSDRAQREILDQVNGRIDATRKAGLLTPRLLLPIVIDIFETTAVIGCDRTNDGDALLAQWGTYDFAGAAEYQFDLTRQFTVTAMQDGPMTHLKTTFYYGPSDVPPIQAGNIWSFAHASVESFQQAVEAQPGFQAVADIVPRRSVIELERV